jgi:integrase/recombinase XerD
MFDLPEQVEKFKNMCAFAKKLNQKTIKAYSIDLEQFVVFSKNAIDKDSLLKYIEHLHKNCKPKTVKRKIACLKTFTNYLLCEDLIDYNPFSKIKTSFKEPFILPKTIPLDVIQKILICAYNQLNRENLSPFHKKEIIRDIAVLELLFATGARVSEICNLRSNNVDLKNHFVKIYGKGSRERIIQIENTAILHALETYYSSFKDDI